MSTVSGDWDARTYNVVANPHEQWATRILDEVPLRGDEPVMDAGCGTGRMTKLILSRLPWGVVFAVDNSPAMLEVATEQLNPYGGRVRLVEADLVTVQLPEQVEVVFSNAAFHWVLDHEALFANLAAQIQSGGILAAQCGGAGNVAHNHAVALQVLQRAPFKSACAGFSGIESVWNFAGPEETKARLDAAGFTSVRTSLEPAPVSFQTAEEFGTFLRTIGILKPFLACLPEDMRDAYVAAVVQEDGGARTVDYVRLNIMAARA